MPLTDIQCKNLKPESKPKKVTDSKGLFMLVLPNGAKYWRFKYQWLGKEKNLAFGVYPETSLSDARKKRDEARKLVRQGTDPDMVKKQEKRDAVLNAATTFEGVAREWHDAQQGKWTPKHARNVMHKLETDIFPHIGNRPVADIDAPEVLLTLRKIEDRGALDMAARARGLCEQIFRYSIATGKRTDNPTCHLKGALKTRKTEHFAAIEARELPAFLSALNRNDARLFPSTRHALTMLMLTFVRTSELINATWDEFDLENSLWEIPAERMKMRRPHIVPLSRQVLDILHEQKKACMHLRTPYVFPGPYKPGKPMSNNTILKALSNLGYKGVMTGHGFRALARTTIREKLCYDADVIERQLAHAHRNKVVAAYDRAQFIDERVKMMQDWADYIDTQATNGKVVVGKFRDIAA